MRRQARLAAAAACALVTTIAAGGCASLPTSGRVRVSTLHGSGGGAQLGVQILAMPPEPRWTPAQIVRGFLAASASGFANDHAVAREFLTPAYAKRWRPGWAATVIGAPTVKEVSTSTRVTTGGPLDAQVNVESQYLATMTTVVKYEAGNVVVSPGPNVFEFALTQVNGLWRIDDVYANNHQTHRTLLLLTQFDFERDYQSRNLYYFPAGPPVNALIPEPVYIPQQEAAKRVVRGLVQSLIHPPPESSWLYGAAATAFPKGSQLLGVQVVDGIKAVIDLGGTAARAGQADRKRMAAQLYWTLTSSPYSTPAATQIRSVVLQLNHQTWHQLLPPNYSGLIPRGQVGQNAAQLFFQAPDLTEPSLRVMSQSGPVAVPVPHGLVGGPFGAIAVTPGPADQVVVAGCRGKDLYLMPQWRGTEAVSRALPASCTSLSWDDHGDLWVTAGGDAYVLPAAGLGSAARPAVVRVFCPATSCSGAITSLRLAPDGVRAAMIVRSGSKSRVMVAAISKNASFTYLGQTGALIRVGSDIRNPIALTWLDPDHLLVLDRPKAGRSTIYEVPLNGETSTQIATPPGVDSLTASWAHADALPSVVVGVKSTGTGPAEILKSSAGLLNRGWSLVAKGTVPVFPG